MIYLLAPHNDDEALFAAIIIHRFRPRVVVVTDSHVQANRGQPITPAQRRRESMAGMAVIGPDIKVSFLGVRDDETPEDFGEALIHALLAVRIPDDAVVIAPALQGGHRQHDAVHIAACRMFRNVIWYATYASGEGFTPVPGYLKLVPSAQESALKRRVLECYPSQAWQTHFGAVEGKPEYISRYPGEVGA